MGPAAVIRASAAEDEPEVHAALARDLAPSTPAFQIGHALSLLEAGETGAATLATEKAGVALARNLSAQLWWVENFAFASMIVLLACTDAGLASWYFGISTGWPEVAARFGVPDGFQQLGAIAIGHHAGAETVAGSVSKRPRKPLEDHAVYGGWRAR